METDPPFRAAPQTDQREPGPALVTGSVAASPAPAGRGYGNARQLVLRGSLAGAKSTTAISLGTAAGYTTNAGPALDRVGSALTTMNAEILHAIEGEGKQLSLQAVFGKREYHSRNELSEETYQAKATYTRSLRTGTELGVSVNVGKRIDVDENVAETGLSLAYQWPKAPLTAFVEVSSAYLDYDAVEGDIFEFGNQDDRDRLSTILQGGFKYQVSEPFAVKFGAGIDFKRYTRARDDFGLARDNLSAFPFLGVAYVDKGLTAELLYAPVYRTYSETTFGPLFAHTLAAKGEVQATSAIKLFASAKAGLEETDFLIAKTIREYVLSGGGVITSSEGTAAGLEVTYTLRDFAGFERVDHKLEATVRAKTPIGGDFFLTGEAKYMTFKSGFASAETDMLMATVGLSYQLRQ